MTPSDIIRQALLNCGISLSQTIYAEDMYRGFDFLNMMVSQWNRKRWVIFTLIDVACTATGAEYYTIGPSGDFDTARPDKIEAAYVRLLPVTNDQPVDTPLTIIEAHETYSLITLKKMQSYPMSVFYDSSYTLVDDDYVGKIYVWPVPPAGQYETHLILKQQIDQFANMTDAIEMPPEYLEAMVWNLAVKLRSGYSLPPDDAVNRMAALTLNTVRQANTQVPVLTMPQGYPTNGPGNFPPWQAGMTGTN